MVTQGMMARQRESAEIEVSIIIPVYNSTRSLEELVERLVVALEECVDDYEILFVDDRSPEPRTWETLKRLSLECNNVRAIQLTRNFGQQAATLCGLRESRGKFVITMDDDLQHDPRDIPRLLEGKDHDIVIGQLGRKQHSWSKRTTSWIKGFFDQVIIGKPKTIQLSSFRLLNRTVVDGMLSMRTPNPFIPAMMFHVSKDVVGIDVHHDRRRHGRSGYNFFKRLRLFSNLIINNSSLVLRLVGHMGMAFSVLSILFGFMVIYKKLVLGVPIQGWASILTALLLIGGLMLFSLGVVGEYLVRIIEGTEVRPTYYIRHRTGESPELP
jgi:dolichol-phosphate mannosyltransferase/undecaprenyl-phosphate 4-deoxy-4-formamido-L-arabinose transferase